MLNKIQAVALAAALAIPGHRLAGQSANAAVMPATPCRHCDRPTPFEKTEGVAVTIMLRDGFADHTIDAVIRDEPGSAGKPLIAVKSGALTPALVYRALASLSESRVAHGGPPSTRVTKLLSAGSQFQSVPAEDRSWVAQLMTRLSAAPVTDIPGVGRFPAVTLTIDKQALRGK